jgi:hypothetical protein
MLHVTAETTAEVMEVWQHYRLAQTPESIISMAAAVQAGTYEHVSVAKVARPWFDVDVYLDRSLKPYQDLLKRLTGYDGPLPDMGLTAKHPHRLCYTRITNSVEIKDGMIHSHVYMQAEDWNKRDAATNAQINADDYEMEYFGKRHHEPEYIHDRQGNPRHNPNYLQRNRAKPGLGCPWLWDVIFGWWRETHASERQRELLAGVDALDSGRHGRDYSIQKGGGDEAVLSSYSLYVLDPNGKCAVYTWEQFKAMGTPEGKAAAE